MNLVDLILKEHSKAQKDKIVRYVGNDAKRFAELVALFFKGPYRVTQRASWPLSSIVEKHPALVKPHLKKILQNVMKSGQHDAVKRNTLRLLQYIEIPKSLQGIAVDVCFQLLTDRKEPVAIHAFAITVLTTLARQEPDLKNELIPLIEEQLPYSSPAFVSRAKRALKELK
ncbi:MAG TPA: hypothetical protein VIT44_03005 [Cyclobacteriaceae bacterium]